MWGKAKCPKCGKIINQWNALAVDGAGGITFDAENGEVDFSDVIVTNVDFMCPTKGCGFILQNVGTDKLEKWFQKHKVIDNKEVKQ